MPLPIRDGNQSLTTLSTILVSNSHIPAHTVVSLGTQAITDIATAVSGVELGPNTLNALENITVTLGQVTITGGLTDTQLRASAVTIGGVVTATISGTPSVTFGTAVITGSTSVLNFPVTQPVSIASVTIGNSVTIGSLPNISGTVTVSNLPATQAVTFGQSTITGSVSILNLPATQTVTFTQAPVTFGTSVITGSASILNFPATQTVTFTQASVTFGTAVVTGSTSILNFPATQAVTFTTASVTFGTAVITGSTSVLNFPATQTVTFSQASVTFGLISGTVTANPAGTQTIAGTVTANVGNAQFDEDGNLLVCLQSGSNPSTQSISGSVTVGNSVTIASLPAISGTVTANSNSEYYDSANARTLQRALLSRDSGDQSGDTEIIGAYSPVDPSGYVTLPISGTVTVGNTVTIAGTVTANPTGTQTIAGSVTLGAGTAQIGSVTASISGTVPVSISSVTVGNTVTIAGTVTAIGQANGTTLSSLFPIGIDTLFSGVRPVADLYGYRVPVSLGDSNAVVSASLSDPLPVGTNRIGVVTIGGGTVTIGAGTAQIGSVTVGNSVTIGSLPAISGTVTIGNSVTIGSLPAISGTVTANVAGQYFDGASGDTAQLTNPVYFDGEIFRVSPSRPLPVALATGYNFGASVTVGNSVTIASLPAISGTVTANSSNGSLTTRFGSVTTANTAFQTSAVTNANRKYLLIQNVTTASTVITVGIGFTPTTTQGIQLTAGAGITFESSYIPTGAVYVLSAVTSSNFTILEA